MANERSDVSICVKYLVFFFNVFFWVIGGLMIAVGLYARLEKTAYQEFFSDILTDPAFALIIVGCVMFILGFSGCIGALRENICLLKFFSVFLAIIFFLQLSLAVAAFVFQDKMEQVIVDKLRVAIKNYRDNYDLQNLIDGVQTEFKCCGGRTINDWDQNIYFNCSSPGSESCGVPFSCCKEDTINRQCGYKIRKKGVSSSDRSSKIYTKGCVDSVKDWFKENLIIIGGVAVGVALLQGKSRAISKTHSRYHFENLGMLWLGMMKNLFCGLGYLWLGIPVVWDTCGLGYLWLGIPVAWDTCGLGYLWLGIPVAWDACGLGCLWLGIPMVWDTCGLGYLWLGIPVAWDTCGDTWGIPVAWDTCGLGYLWLGGYLWIMGICFANSLMSDIKMQKKRWNRDYPSH
ncbi:hypothetical protein QZH41_010349 [Actinostola sp. cb2023]|nr:hypothetical protein QZH41_010349 [Actinostola sp. cb2023]